MSLTWARVRYEQIVTRLMSDGEAADDTDEEAAAEAAAAAPHAVRRIMRSSKPPQPRGVVAATPDTGDV